MPTHHTVKLPECAIVIPAETKWLPATVPQVSYRVFRRHESEGAFSLNEEKLNQRFAFPNEL